MTTVDTTAAVARTGAFVGPSQAFGVPLEIAHPSDNRFPQFEPEIEALNISLAEKAKLQEEAEALTGALIVGRDIAE